MPKEARRRHQIPWNWITEVVRGYVHEGNQTLGPLQKQPLLLSAEPSHLPLKCTFEKVRYGCTHLFWLGFFFWFWFYKTGSHFVALAVWYSLCSQAGLKLTDPPASASRVLGLKGYADVLYLSI